MAEPSNGVDERGKRKRTSSDDDHLPLLPGLPDHLAQLCLSRVPPRFLYSVCRSWRRLLYAPYFPPFLSLYALLSSAEHNSEDNVTPIGFYSFDPISSSWIPLPQPPSDFPLLIRHPCFLARDLPVQSVAIADHLILLAATTFRLHPALSHPLIFHPISNQWHLGPPIISPRRWCVTGSVRGSVYIASGVGSEYRTDVARSVERWNLIDSRWEQVSALVNCKFSREAVDGVGLKGKLFMVNMKGKSAKDGIVYVTGNDVWEDMPRGMLSGWNGPAAAMEEQMIYVLDEEIGALKEYDEVGDYWKCIIENEILKGAVQITAASGRVCVVCAGGSAIAVVDIKNKPARMWMVDPPQGTRILALHALPRISSSQEP